MSKEHRFKSYRSCFVPLCRSTTVRTPDKVFLTVPQERQRRVEWFSAARRKKSTSKSYYYCCEDHFDLENDLHDYQYFKRMGGRAQPKNNVVPHKFECQLIHRTFEDAERAKLKLDGDVWQEMFGGCLESPTSTQDSFNTQQTDNQEKTEKGHENEVQFERIWVVEEPSVQNGIQDPDMVINLDDGDNLNNGTKSKSRRKQIILLKNSQGRSRMSTSGTGAQSENKSIPTESQTVTDSQVAIDTQTMLGTSEISKQCTPTELIEIKSENIDVDNQSAEQNETQREESPIVPPASTATSSTEEIVTHKDGNEWNEELGSMLKTIAKERQKRKRASQDEFDVFGDLIARKLRHLPSRYARITLQQMITNLVYNAELGRYDEPTTQNQEPAAQTSFPFPTIAPSMPSSSVGASTGGFLLVPVPTIPANPKSTESRPRLIVPTKTK